MDLLECPPAIFDAIVMILDEQAQKIEESEAKSREQERIAKLKSSVN